MSRISAMQVIERSDQAAISIQIKVPLKEMQEAIDESREKLMNFLQEMAAFPAGSFYVTYYSFSKEAVECEAGFPLYKEITGENQIKASRKRGGLYLTCYHQGAYRKIPSIYREMDTWLLHHHFETSGVTEEIYLNHDVEDSQRLTQVLISISQKELSNDDRESKTGK